MSTPEEDAGEITSKWEHIVATKLHKDITEVIREAIADEREACARVADERRSPQRMLERLPDDIAVAIIKECDDIAAAIRARGNVGDT